MVYPIGVRVTSLANDLGVEFRYLIGGHDQTFIVSRSLLESRFGIDESSNSDADIEKHLLEAFDRAWDRIRSVAARSRRVPSNSPVTLNSDDF